MSHFDDEEDEGVSLGRVRLVAQSKDAIKVTPLDDNEELDEDIWVPKSQVHDDSDVHEDMNGDVGELIITTWWADKKGFT